MKKIILALIIGLSCIAVSCTDDVDGGNGRGTIYGVVTDSKTAEPVRAIGVELYAIDEGNLSLLLKTVTFDDGHFEFDDLEPDKYLLKIVAEGYYGTSYSVLVESGRTARADMQVSKSQTYMTVNTLEVEAPVDGVYTFKGTYNSLGSDFDPTEVGFIYGQSQSLDEGNGTLIKAEKNNFTCTVSIKDLKVGSWYVKAYAKNTWGYEYGQVRKFEVKSSPVVKTLDVTNTEATTATLNGLIVYEGDPKYTGKGFVYSSSFPMPTLDDPEDATTKVSISGNSNEFSANISGLIEDKTYHVRAYAKSSGGIVYGETVSFVATAHKPYIIIGNLAIQLTDLDADATWSEAMDICSKSRVGGFSDWRLPTLGELKEIYASRSLIGGFSDDWYWTSDRYDDYNNYYIIRFRDGDVGTTRIYTDCHVRAVRTVK